MKEAFQFASQRFAVYTPSVIYSDEIPIKPHSTQLIYKLGFHKLRLGHTVKIQFLPHYLKPRVDVIQITAHKHCSSGNLLSAADSTQTTNPEVCIVSILQLVTVIHCHQLHLHDKFGVLEKGLAGQCEPSPQFRLKQIERITSL